jgi:hypothetical protein
MMLRYSRRHSSGWTTLQTIFHHTRVQIPALESLIRGMTTVEEYNGSHVLGRGQKRIQHHAAAPMLGPKKARAYGTPQDQAVAQLNGPGVCTCVHVKAVRIRDFS